MASTKTVKLLDSQHAARTLELQRKQESAPLRWRRKRLTDAQSVRAFMGYLVNAVGSGELAPETATKMGALCQTLLQALRQDELSKMDERLAELERRLSEAGQ